MDNQNKQIKLDFGNTIRKFRQKHNIDIDQLSEIIGIPPDTLSNLELGMTKEGHKEALRRLVSGGRGR